MVCIERRLLQASGLDREASLSNMGCKSHNPPAPPVTGTNQGPLWSTSVLRACGGVRAALWGQDGHGAALVGRAPRRFVKSQTWP